MSVVIFDLYGTLITEEEYDYGRALRWLADTYFDSRIAELQDLSERFKANYLQMRSVSNSESSFCEQLRFFESALHSYLSDDYEAVEAGFIRVFRKEKLKEGASSILRLLQTRGIRISILTNSLFSGKNLKAHLATVGIGEAIEAVFSSADIGYRKPAQETFHYALSALGIRDASQVVYIGDSYKKDYLGARKSGLNTVLVSSDPEYADIAYEDLHAVESWLKADGAGEAHSCSVGS